MRVWKLSTGLLSPIAVLAVVVSNAMGAGDGSLRRRHSHSGVLVGAIRFGGGPHGGPCGRHYLHHQCGPGIAGEVSVYRPSGRLVARRHVRTGHGYRFRLPAGRYLMNAGDQLYYPRPQCEPVAVRVLRDRVVHADVFIGCDVP